ncbi:MAG TPA: hypothetical protein ENF58_00980 [Candidatus Altiarchaeales archaeon]|nr:hypothetical protein [Candidatus Altiarchaeales archaeon]
MAKEKGKVEDILEDLNSVEGVTGSLVTGKDGVLISQKAPPGTDVDLASAMAATVFGTGEKTISELKLGEITQAMIEGNTGKTLIVASKKAILTVMTSPDVSLGLIRLKMMRAIEDIEKSL